MVECNDKKCPFHGNVKIRGQIIEGYKVMSTKMPKGAVVEKILTQYIPKYERYKKVKSKLTVHNPPCINAQRGDIVTIAECRKLSKTKSFVIIEKRKGEEQ
ncbi:MAG: 30S ribosomal protein S17 [Candidatus Diapherotrites archaeon]|nr:30S ribosomal protein S17 [Candidatus Diapherotrites archaeon]